jgi:hypothetical protein
MRTFIFSLFAMLVFSTAAFGQKGDTIEKSVKFARGKSSVTLKGFIADRMTTNLYHVRARAGQTLTIVFNSARKDADVCLLIPNGGQDLCGQRKYSVKLTTDGDYQILVDSYRENLAYTLTVSVK